MSFDSTNQHLLEVLFIGAPVPVLGSSSRVELSTCQEHLWRRETVLVMSQFFHTPPTFFSCQHSKDLESHVSGAYLLQNSMQE